jgi:hypothetical protein
MKTKTSMLKLAKLGSVGLLFTIHNSGTQAAMTTTAAHSNAQIDAEISSMADSVSMALSSSGMGAEAEADSGL